MLYEEGSNQKEEEEISEEDLKDILGAQKAQLVDKLLEDKNLPDTAEEKFPAFFDKEMALTFLKDSDVRSLLNEFDDTFVSDLMNRFPSEFKGQEETDVTQLRARLKAKLLRSRGKGRHNERMLWETDITEAMYGEPQSDGGIISKMRNGAKKMFGKGR